MSLVATPANSAIAAISASDATPASKAAQLLARSGFRRTDQKLHKLETTVAPVKGWRQRLEPTLHMLLRSHFENDADKVAKFKLQALQKLEPFWDSPEASELGPKDVDFLRTCGDYLALAAIVSKSHSVEVVRVARIALCEALNHPKAASPAEAQKVRELLALGRELLGDDVVTFTPEDGGMMNELRLDPLDSTEMDEAVLGLRLGAPNKKRKVEPLVPIPSQCAIAESDSDSDAGSDAETNPWFGVDERKWQAFENNKERNHARATSKRPRKRYMCERQMAEEMAEQDAVDNPRFLGADACMRGECDYGDTQDFQDDEE